MIKFILAVGLALTKVSSESFSLDLHDECLQWATEDKECSNNPTFMWGECISSCMKYATDTDVMCEDWALAGECSANPQFIHTHCPRSCGNAIGWHPWIRREVLKIDIVPVPILLDECSLANDVFSAAEVIRKRLVETILHGHGNVIGLSDRY